MRKCLFLSPLMLTALSQASCCDMDVSIERIEWTSVIGLRLQVYNRDKQTRMHIHSDKAVNTKTYTVRHIHTQRHLEWQANGLVNRDV